MATSKHPSSQRGFGSMGEDKQRNIASKGGKSVPAEERSFSKDHELASEAGRKGGKAGGGAHSKGGTHEQHVKAGQQSHKHT